MAKITADELAAFKARQTELRAAAAAQTPEEREMQAADTVARLRADLAKGPTDR